MVAILLKIKGFKRKSFPYLGILLFLTFIFTLLEVGSSHAQEPLPCNYIARCVEIEEVGCESPCEITNIGDPMCQCVNPNDPNCIPEGQQCPQEGRACCPDAQYCQLGTCRSEPIEEGIRYTCSPEGCVESEHGAYTNYDQCVTECHPQRINIFCDRDGNPTSNPSSGKLYTAIGCIPVKNLQAFAGFFLSWGMGVAGGIAILLIIYAAFMIITSAGNPQRIQAGKELLTAAIMGLLLLLFGVWILRFIGVQILKIPGLIR